MTTAYVIATVVGAIMAAFSAASIFFRAQWVVQPLADYGVPRGWWTPLGGAKAAGALGLIAGLWVPALGVAAGIGLVLYFTGAVITVLRAHWPSHVAFPLMYMAPVAASLVLGFAA
ncbi:DoxX-like family protein [Amycolatopsis lurida]|uniref:Membrane protein n=1 Tax=Amycolatopsis lurida NRRL 2430 TaxID=1460371 RepID=A0A2P2FPB8_AMYLU|nr:DoxX family protein [Amycolatopsis lurida]KFU78557.1 membrane protein [Amycolatopsis lurida NRRL 2430]SEE23031.1 DoxX-like family protein [Amycolatopsis lurida]